MIEFKGEISEECRKYAVKYGMLIVFAGSGAVSLLFILAILIIAIVLKFWILLISIVPFVYMPLLFPIAFSTKKEQETFIPTRIYIDIEDETIGVECKRHSSERGFDVIKKIVDHGNWYTVDFYLGHKDTAYIIQKDLIKQGTIEEFEALFADKIERIESSDKERGKP